MSSDGLDIASNTFHRLLELSTTDKPLVFSKSDNGMMISIGEHKYCSYGYYDFPNMIIEAYAYLLAQIQVEAHKEQAKTQNSSMVLKI